MNYNYQRGVVCAASSSALRCDQTADSGWESAPGYSGVTSNAVASSAVESPPTHTSKVEHSVTQSRTAPFQYRRSFGPIGNWRMRDSRAARVTRRKPLSSRTGRDAEPRRWCRYSWTTSSAARSDVLVTSTDTVTVPLVVTAGRSTVRSAYSNRP